MIRKFRVLEPNIVEAEQISLDASSAVIVSENALSVTRICSWMALNGFHDVHIVGDHAPFGLWLKTPLGNRIANPGDWIIRHPYNGAFLVYTGDEFPANFAPIEEAK